MGRENVMNSETRNMRQLQAKNFRSKKIKAEYKKGILILNKSSIL